MQAITVQGTQRHVKIYPVKVSFVSLVLNTMYFKVTDRFSYGKVQFCLSLCHGKYKILEILHHYADKKPAVLYNVICFLFSTKNRSSS